MSTKSFNVSRYDGEGRRETQDRLVAEAPLHVKVNGHAYATTMRTPGADRALVRGMLFTEGIVRGLEAPLSFEEIPDPEYGFVACLEVSVDEDWITAPVEGRRSQLATSSCGICGTRDPKDIELYGDALDAVAAPPFDLTLLPAMAEDMMRGQTIFRQTGGSHAAAFFTLEGAMLSMEEDIGRHNAVDKALGRLFKSDARAKALCLFISGRLSYEIVVKAYKAGAPIIAAVSAPSSLAVETADRFGMTVLAFCRGEKVTCYSHEENLGQRLEAGSYSLGGAQGS